MKDMKKCEAVIPRVQGSARVSFKPFGLFMVKIRTSLVTMKGMKKCGASILRVQGSRIYLQSLHALHGEDPLHVGRMFQSWNWQTLQVSLFPVNRTVKLDRLGSFFLRSAS